MSAGILIIDQGTSSTRAIVFDLEGRVVAADQEALQQHCPHSGWVEQDAEDIWRTVLRTARAAIDKSCRLGIAVQAIGITNQRETTVVWDRETHQPIHRAIVWQDRRTAETCEQLSNDGAEELVAERTGLLVDPYFSATKIAWLLDNVAGARAAAEAGRLAFGTIDSFLLWRLTNGRVHRTDTTNASRTSLFDINRLTWDADMLNLFGVPASVLPQVFPCAHEFAVTDKGVLGISVPVTGIAGDQQAALMGQACFARGSAKATYGTGGFVLLNTGSQVTRSRARLISTVGYQIADSTAYALEGSIFVAGAGVQWLRDELGFFSDAGDTDTLAREAADDDGIYIVPAFTGLGAPHWLPQARGSVFGLTRSTSRGQLVRALLQSVAYQTVDLLNAMSADGVAINQLNVDGGMSANDWFCHFLADVIGHEVRRPKDVEATARGALFLAAKGADFTEGSLQRPDSMAVDVFEPRMERGRRDRLVSGWKRAVAATQHFANG